MVTIKIQPSSNAVCFVIYVHHVVTRPISLEQPLGNLAIKGTP